MPYRITYSDAYHGEHLVAVADTVDDARLLTNGLGAAVPQAAGRLTIVDDPMLGLTMRVVQPPHTIDTAGGLPVLYLGGTIDPVVNWQATAITALQASPVVIANPRRERPNPAQDDSVAAVKWRERHLLTADIAVFWFFGNAPDPMSLLELGNQLGSTTRMAVGATPDWSRRAALAARLDTEVPALPLYESLDATLTRATELLAEPFDDRQLRASQVISDPEVVACLLCEAITEVDLPKDGDNAFHVVLADAACAAALSVDPLLLTRLYVAVDRVRLDAVDPLGWTELHDLATALKPT
jgi:hypothetical protein